MIKITLSLPWTLDTQRNESPLYDDKNQTGRGHQKGEYSDAGKNSFLGGAPTMAFRAKTSRMDLFLHI